MTSNLISFTWPLECSLMHPKSNFYLWKFLRELLSYRLYQSENIIMINALWPWQGVYFKISNLTAHILSNKDLFSCRNAGQNWYEFRRPSNWLPQQMFSWFLSVLMWSLRLFPLLFCEWMFLTLPIVYNSLKLNPDYVGDHAVFPNYTIYYHKFWVF